MEKPDRLELKPLLKSLHRCPRLVIKDTKHDPFCVDIYNERNFEAYNPACASTVDYKKCLVYIKNTEKCAKCNSPDFYYHGDNTDILVCFGSETIKFFIHGEWQDGIEVAYEMKEFAMITHIIKEIEDRDNQITELNKENVGIGIRMQGLVDAINYAGGIIDEIRVDTGTKMTLGNVRLVLKKALEDISE